MKGDHMNIENGVNEGQNNEERKVPTDSNDMANSEVDIGDQSQYHEDRVPNDANMANSEVVLGDQSRVSAPSNNENLSQDPANVSETSLVRAQPSTSVQRRFGRKRVLSEANDELDMRADNASMIQSLESQPSQPVSSQLEGCRNCAEYKVEVKRLRQTNIRITRDAEASKKRMDKNLAISLNGQEAMQKELTLLRRNNKKLHTELTSVKGVLREIQSAIARYKF